MKHIHLLFDYGYFVGLRGLFPGPDGLTERMAEYQGKYIIFDPHSNCDGFCIVGDNLEALVNDAVEHLELAD